MIWSDSKFPDGSTMLLGRITLVAFPVVLRIFFCQRIHVIITIGLGKDAGSCNRQILAVTLYDGCIRQILVGFEAVTIHDNLELVQGTVHSQKTGVEDIDFIDFFWSNNAHGPSYSITLYLLALTACSGGSSELDPTQKPAPAAKVPINISTSIQSRATDLAFEAGDQIGLFVVNHQADGSAATLQTTGNYIDNLKSATYRV